MTRGATLVKLVLGGCVVALGAAMVTRLGPRSHSQPVVDAVRERTSEARSSPTELLPEEPPPAEVHGTVRDANGDPVPGAVVKLLGDAGIEHEVCGVCEHALIDCSDSQTAEQVLALLRAAGSAGHAGETVETDAEGAFRFAGERRGHVRLLVSKRGVGDAAGVFDAADEIALMLAPAVVSVFRVVDEEGAPISGATVTTIDRGSLELGEQRTDGAGEVKVALRGQGDDGVWVLASAPGVLPYVEPAYSPQSEEPNQITLAKPRRLIVQTRSMGESIDADVSVERGDGGHRLVGRSTGGEVIFDELAPQQVTITAETSALRSPETTVSLEDPETMVVIDLRTLARLMVRVVDTSGQPVADAHASLGGTMPTVEATSDERGVLPGFVVVEGAYSLDVWAEEMSLVHLPVDLKAGDNALEVVMRKSLRIRGTVVDADGEGAGGVSLSVFGAMLDASLSTVSNSDGTFELLVDEPGRYRLEASDSERGKATADVAAPADGVTLSLEPRAGLRVHVTGPTGPLSGAFVSVAQSGSRRIQAQAVTNDGGVVDFVGFDAMKATVRVGNAVGLRDAVLDDVTLVLHRMTEVSIALDAGVSVSGIVVDEANVPLAGATVMSDPPTISVATDDRGAFTLEALDPEQTYALRVETEGRAQAAPTSVRGARDDVRLVLVPKPVVSGRVVSANGTPIVDAMIAGRAGVDDAGRFTVTVESEQPLELLVVAPGYVQRTVTMPFRADIGDVVLERAARLTGVVEDERGRPLGGVFVTCDVCEDNDETGSDGTFSLSRVSSSPTHTLTVIRGEARASVTSDAEQLRIVLRRPTHVMGRLVDADGRPASGTVFAQRTDGEPVRVEALHDGRFAVELAEGTWVFWSRLSSRTQRFEISGETMEITIGAAGARCGVSLRVPDRVDRVWLLPGDAASSPLEDEVTLATPAAIAVSDPGSDGLPWVARGLDCGDYAVVLVAEGLQVVRRMTVAEAQSALTVELDPPR